MSVSLDQVIAAAGRRLAPLTAECAGHAVLAVADQVAQAPNLVESAQLSLEENGSIRILRGSATDELECERRLRQLLDQLMRVARGGGGALFRAALGESAGDLPRFVRELEAALIPANRAAARRSLVRLHRETLRAVEAGRLELPAASPAPSPAAPGASPAQVPPSPPAEAAPAPSPQVAQVVPPAPVPSPPAAQVPPSPPAEAAPAPSPQVAQVPPSPVPSPSASPAQAPPEPLAPCREASPVTPPTEASPVPSPTAAQVPAEPGASPSEVEVSPAAPARAGEHGAWSVQDDEEDLEIDVHVSPELPPVSVQAIEGDTEPVPESPEEPQETATPLEPIMQRVRERESMLPAIDDGRTPYLGTRVALLAPPPLPDMPTASDSVVGDDGATDPMPPVEYIESDSIDDDCDPDDDALTPYLDRNLGVAVQADDSVPIADPDESASGEPSELPPGVAGSATREVPIAHPPAPPRYTRKSDVSELLRNFTVADPEPSRNLLSDLKTLAGVEASATPPPVAVSSKEEEDVDPQDEKVSSQSIRPVGMVTVVGAVLCVAAFAGPKIVNARAESALAAPARPVPPPMAKAPPCRATVHVVGAPSNARIEVRPKSPNPRSPAESQWATGPEASFSQLPCATALEVLVRLGTNEQQRWARVPISRAELTPPNPESGRVQFAVDLTGRELY